VGQGGHCWRFHCGEHNTITTAQEFWSNGEGIQLGESGQSFRTVLNGHLNAAGMLPTGWFGGYAVRDKD
jgi:hypothetical protein